MCKEENVRKDPDACPYPKHRKVNAPKKACQNSEKKLAHIYLRHEKFNKKVRSCVVIFIEGENLRQNCTDELLGIFQDTVEWLKIADEKPYLHILRYGHPAPALTTGHIRNYLDEKIKKIYSGYPQGEDTCVIAPVESSAESVIINHTNIYSVRAS